MLPPVTTTTVRRPRIEAGVVEQDRQRGRRRGLAQDPQGSVGVDDRLADLRPR